MKRLPAKTWLLIAVAWLTVVAAAQEKTPLRIVWPPSGTEVHPGETIEFKLEADPGITDIALIGWDPLPFVAYTGGPLVLSMKIPDQRISARLYQVTAVGLSKDKQEVNARPIQLQVEPDFDPVRLRAEFQFMHFQSRDLHPENGESVGLPMLITGTSEDGRNFDVTESAHIEYRSLNPKVATVDERSRVVYPVSPGRTAIVVKTRRSELYVQVEVEDDSGNVPARESAPQAQSEEDAKPCPYPTPTGAPCSAAPPEMPRRTTPPLQ